MYTNNNNLLYHMQEETQRIIYSWSEYDPFNEHNVPKHDYMGSISLNLLGGPEDIGKPPADSESFSVTNNKVSTHVAIYNHYTCMCKSIHAALNRWLYICSYSHILLSFQLFFSIKHINT